MKWGSGFLLNHPTIDDQHMRLFALTNRLAVHLAGSAEKDRWRESAGELRQFTARHFEFEELLMVQAGYPALDDHQLQHRELLGELDLFCAQPERQPLRQREMKSKAVTFLHQWLEAHLTLSDRAFVAWLRSRQP